MSKYTSDDNRSMQLNDNNDRYYSSRGIDRYDDDDDDTCSYQMPIGNTTRHLSDESMSHACPHGCHEQSNYYPHQYSQFKCHHQKIKKDIPRLLRRLKWAEAQLGEPLPQNETRENQKLMVCWERKTYNDALKV